MKNNLFKAFGLFALAALIGLSGCKYEDGPGISLRSKRDRVSNEWLLSEYTITDDQGNSTEPTLDLFDTAVQNNVGIAVLNIMRTGAFNIVESPVNRYLFPGQLDTAFWFNADRAQMQKIMGEYTDAMGLFTGVLGSPDAGLDKKVAPAGTWNFNEKHSSLNLSWNHPTLDTLDQRAYEILELREDALKLKWVDDSDNKHELSFEPLNDEDFFL